MERTFCFVDIAGFSALTEAHGDETGADLVDRFTAVVEGALGGDGERVATVGDAVFLVSQMPAGTLRVLERVWRQADAEPEFPSLRAGVHHGAAAQRGRQFYGTAVNVAARVAAEAAGGQVVVTALIAEAAKELGLPVEPLGVRTMKNLRDPVELFAVRIGGAPNVEVVDPVCRMRVVPERAAAHLELSGRRYWFCSKDCLNRFVSEGR